MLTSLLLSISTLIEKSQNLESKVVLFSQEVDAFKKPLFKIGEIGRCEQWASSGGQASELSTNRQYPWLERNGILPVFGQGTARRRLVKAPEFYGCRISEQCQFRHAKEACSSA